jgi:hypothetical protein
VRANRELEAFALEEKVLLWFEGTTLLKRIPEDLSWLSRMDLVKYGRSIVVVPKAKAVPK